MFLPLLGLGNVDGTGWLRTGTRIFYIFYCWYHVLIVKVYWQLWFFFHCLQGHLISKGSGFKFKQKWSYLIIWAFIVTLTLKIAKPSFHMIFWFMMMHNHIRSWFHEHGYKLCQRKSPSTPCEVIVVYTIQKFSQPCQIMATMHTMLLVTNAIIITKYF